MTDYELLQMVGMLDEYISPGEEGWGMPRWPGEDRTMWLSAQGPRFYAQLVALSEGVYRG